STCAIVPRRAALWHLCLRNTSWTGGVVTGIYRPPGIAAPATGAPAWYSGPDPQAGLEDEDTSWETHHTRGAAVPSRADVCLVPEEVSSFGRAVGAHCRML